MQIIDDIKLDFDDVLLVPQRSTLVSRSEVDLTRTFHFYHSSHSFYGILPIIAANMDCVGTVAISRELSKFKGLTALCKFISSKNLIEEKLYNVFFTIGMSDNDRKKIEQLANEKKTPTMICIDVPNGYMENFTKYCKGIRDLCPDSVIMAGNVCTPEMVQELILHGGVDIVKVGIGPGSVCTTRMVTGVGFPQLSAIIECSHAAHGLKNGDGRLGLICADGGCKTPGDISKAFCAGADFVMLGGMFAGCDGCEGSWEYKNGIPHSFSYYGMSSYDAQEKYGGLDKTYRASEGTKITIPYKGSVGDVMKEILGGLRSTGTYIGADCLKAFPKCAHFIRVNRVK